jgi:hypothetical protein
LAPYQIEINKVLFYVQRAIQLGHAPKWWVPAAASIPKGYLNNNIGTIIPIGGGQAPTYYAPQPIHNQVVEYLQMIKNEGYAMVGISQMSSRSEKPAGLNSGKALQTYNDIETERFVLAGQEYEEFHVNAFGHVVRACKIIAEHRPEFSVLSEGPFGSEMMAWNDISMEDDKYLVKPYAVSSLPQEPAARFSALQERLQAGLITPEEFADLNDMPDMRTADRMKYASYYGAKNNVERILRGKDYIAPEKYDDLAAVLRVTVNAYLYARDRGAPEDRLQELRSYIDEVQALKARSEAPTPEAAPAGVALEAVPEGLPMEAAPTPEINLAPAQLVQR